MSSKRPFRGALIAGILLICFYLILYALIGNGNKITYENEKNVENGTSIENTNESYYENLINQLIECESSHKELAINVKDKDGTASFSYLQWKPETFREYAIKYGVIGEKASWNWIMTIIWDYKTNKYLGIQILKNEPEKAKNLWPICWKKIKK